MLDIIEVIFEFFDGVFDAGGVSLLHLGPAGDTRFDAMTPLIEWNLFLELTDECSLLGSRPDDAHVALENVPQLGQLVQTEATQNTTDRRDAVVVTGSKLGAIAL